MVQGIHVVVETTMAARDILRHKWSAITIAVTVGAIACATIVVLCSMPPSAIVMATGAEGGAYYEFGKRYRAELAHANVEVRLVKTAGSLENLTSLLDPHSAVSVALVQGGTIKTEDSSELESLGTVFYEPLWLFRRREVGGGGLEGLRGKKIAIGPDRSGTQALSLELLKRHGIGDQVSELLPLVTREAADRLLAGDIDAAFVVASWDAPDVQRLLADKHIELSSYPQADAYVALYPFLSKVVVPRGVRDLANDQPPTDVVLIAPKASLVVRKDLHPAIQLLLLNAAVHIHSEPGIFRRANEFPAAEAVGLPLSGEALRFYKSGPPFLHNYLPFRIAELVGKLAILLILILGVLYPMMRFLPVLYDWTMRRKILRLYGELRFLEDELEALGSKNVAGKTAAQLDRLDQQANRLRVRVAYASMLYILRHHIDLVRAGLKKHVDKAVE
jgi:TRAP transporter TAXI family solute receptor